MQVKQTSYRQIVGTVLLKTLPLVAAVAVCFSLARRFVPFFGVMPSFIYNALLICAILFAVKLTAGRLLTRLGQEGREPRNG